MEVTNILPDLVTGVAGHLALKELAQASRVNQLWHSAINNDEFWCTVLQRQWLLTSPSMLGATFPGGWQQICRCFCTMSPGKWRPPPNPDEQSALNEMSEQAQHFLFGIAHGYMPCSDDLFTYHCNSATPIHYRHIASHELPLYEDSLAGLRLGGSWVWSADRKAWFPTASHDITSGQFGTGSWELVADNKNIVKFLDRCPLVPLIVREVPLRQVDAVTSHRRINECPASDFMRAVGCGPQPTTSCVEIGAFTVHFHFLPALHVRCTSEGFQMTGSSLRNHSWNVGGGPVQEVDDLMTELLRKRAPIDFIGGVRGQQSLSECIYRYEAWFHQVLMPAAA